MQLGMVSQRVALLACLLVGGSHAAGFLGPRHASLVGQTLMHDRKDMPVTQHNKTAGDGYNPGSPLYEKQQKQADGGAAATPETPKEGSTIGIDAGVTKVTVPPPDSDVQSYWQKNGGLEGHVRRGISHFFGFLVITLLIALIWTKCTSPGRTRMGYDERKNNGVSFAYGLFSLDHCFGHHSHVCLCSWCCYPLRMADTWAKEPLPLIGNFWVALILVTCLLGLEQLSFGFTGFVLLCACTYFRQRLRKQYGLESGGSTCLFDCLTWWCCPCCAMAQEARQVEFVLKSESPMK